MLRFPLFRRSMRTLRRIRRQTETEISELQMDRLRLALTVLGYEGVRQLYGNPAAYDYSGQRDNSLYAATLDFDSAQEGNRFLSEIAAVLRHLQGPGTAGLTITPTGGQAGAGMRIAFNPLLTGIIARRLEAAATLKTAVGAENA
ncbi:hypothetical protein [Arthrobacter sp. zg-Y1110]|uniref:hypothetical protein n=1 Tax=Arthrobacter sp. zg-Y1110 TaxID=2886932 RepID=UPI001D1338C9|nr:hypothetical protein [Arthrobacter sp. zg-Y1110]MCC3292811.1 hypothetical protein [Arthrobacter sp. zg-Y1110]UWX86750.1 hypothetical protein N2K99_18075 [Arthrobacter sp. zg-Y1110]